MSEEHKEIADIKCGRCKCYRYPSQFINDKGRTLKTCSRCRTKGKKSDEKNKCEHGRRKSRCIECDGSSICSHNKTQRNKCKLCKDPVKITIQRWVYRSRQDDKEKHRYDANNFIDYCFLEGLVEDYPKCYWEDCQVKLQYIDYQDDLATIERLDNSIGHIKSNCVLACKKCNCSSKKSNRQTEV